MKKWEVLKSQIHKQGKGNNFPFINKSEKKSKNNKNELNILNRFLQMTTDFKYFIRVVRVLKQKTEGGSRHVILYTNILKFLAN